MGISELLTRLGILKIVHAEEQLEPPKYKWGHTGFLDGFDHASLRRGYQVYKEVCSTCHSMKRIAFRHLINVTHSEEDAKKEAATVQIEDGPDDNGDMFLRPGRISDRFPSPYKNDEAARAANNGAVPPDLTLMIKARPRREDYVFSLLTGYTEVPTGLDEPKPGQHFNPYFPGGYISMARNIYDGVVDYEDGTPATASQIAKDVTTFLAWAAEPELEERKRIGMKAMIIASGIFFGMWYWKKQRWSYLKSMKLVYKKPPTE